MSCLECSRRYHSHEITHVSGLTHLRCSPWREGDNLPVIRVRLHQNCDFSRRQTERSAILCCAIPVYMHDFLGHPIRPMTTRCITSLGVGVYRASGSSPTRSAGQCAPRNSFRQSGDGYTTAMHRTGPWACGLQRRVLRGLLVSRTLARLFSEEEFDMTRPHSPATPLCQS